MTQKTIALVGISGVGKTTFLKNLASELTFQHLTAGTLISEGKSLERADRDKLRLSNINENQKLLILGFHHARNPNIPFVVMDGHVIIHGAEGLETIGSHVFEALGIDAMMHLVAHPQRILENRLKDAGRARPVLSEKELEEHQNSSFFAAQKVCETLNIPCVKVSTSEIDLARRFFLSLQ
jgi:adenylate kinase